MSDVIDFLEQMGRDAHLRGAVGLDLEAALIAADLEPGVRAAFLEGDQHKLELLAGASHNICCMVNVPHEEEEPDEQEEDDDRKDKDDEGDDHGEEGEE